MPTCTRRISPEVAKKRVNQFTDGGEGAPNLKLDEYRVTWTSYDSINESLALYNRRRCCNPGCKSIALCNHGAGRPPRHVQNLIEFVCDKGTLYWYIVLENYLIYIRHFCSTQPVGIGSECT